MTILRFGSAGSEVRVLQENLKKLGLYPGFVDGIFGKMSDSAVESFQRKHGLKVDGVVGPATQAKITEVLNTKTQSLAEKPQEAPKTGGYKEQKILSPNRSIGGNSCEYLILHHSDGWAKDGNISAGDIAHCLNPASQVSYHCIVAWNGARTILAENNDRAFHAGQSSWKGKTLLNRYSIGISFGGNTNTGLRRPNESKDLTPTEIASALEFIIPRARLYGWKLDNILTHAMISPGRKWDTSAAAHKQILDNLRGKV